MMEATPRRSSPASPPPLAIVMQADTRARRFVMQAVEAAGFHVMAADDHTCLLEMLADIAPAVIVLDLKLATLEEMDVLRALANRRVAAGIVLLCTTDLRTLKTARDVAGRFGLQIASTLQKPIRRADLVEEFGRLKTIYATFHPGTLRRCLDRQLVTVHYQPKLSLKSFEVTGVEVLLRCSDLMGRPVSPQTVVDVAEAAGMIDELTERVLTEALQQRRIWSKWGVDLDVAVNLSPRCSFDQRLPELVTTLCADAGVPPEALTIELTETAATDNTMLDCDALDRLRQAGFHLAIDDFGSGYSSLMRLKELPFDEIKIDKSFVTDLLGSRHNEAIVKTIIGLAQTMGMHCVIEGVENEAALRFAVQLGCDSAQGYFIARPMPGRDILHFLKIWAWRRESLRIASNTAEMDHGPIIAARRYR